MDKFLKLVPGGVYALIAAIIALSFILISISQFPGYDMSKSFVSVLGCGPGLSPLFFSLGLIIPAILLIPSFIYLGRILTQEKPNEKLKKGFEIISIISCVSLSLIGFSPCGSFIISFIHRISAVIFFLNIIILSILLTYLILKDTRFSKIHAYPGFFIAIMIAIHIFTRWAWAEWAVFFGLIGWIFEIGIYTLYKRL